MPPAMPATMIQMGDTPSCQMSRAATMGIHTVRQVMWADLESLKIGPRIRAVTAGRMPRNTFSTTLLLRNCWKKRAMARMMSRLGSTQPVAQTMLPLVPRNL